LDGDAVERLFPATAIEFGFSAVQMNNRLGLGSSASR
jgi:hypothetical protein